VTILQFFSFITIWRSIYSVLNCNDNVKSLQMCRITIVYFISFSFVLLILWWALFALDKIIKLRRGWSGACKMVVHRAGFTLVVSLFDLKMLPKKCFLLLFCLYPVIPIHFSLLMSPILHTTPCAIDYNPALYGKSLIFSQSVGVRKRKITRYHLYTSNCNTEFRRHFSITRCFCMVWVFIFTSGKVQSSIC